MQMTGAASQPANATSGPSQPAFAGISPAARALMRDVAARQDRDFYLANRKRYDDLVRTPLTRLVAELEARFKIAAIPLQASRDAVLPVSLDRRPGDRRPRYRPTAVAILSRDVHRQRSFCVGKIVFGASVASVAFGFRRPHVGDLRELAASIERDPAPWTAVERIMARAGLIIEGGLADRVEDAVRRGARVDLMAEVALRPEQFARREIVDRIAELATAAAPFLDRAGLVLRDDVGGRVQYGGVNSLGC